MPNARFHHHATASSDIDTAWTILQDPTTWGSLAGVEKITNVARNESGDLASYEFVARAGGRAYPGVAHTTTSRRPNEMTVRIQSREMDGAIAATLSDLPKGRVEIEVMLELETKGLLSSMFFSIISGVVGSGFPEQVEAIASRLGEPVR